MPIYYICNMKRRRLQVSTEIRVPEAVIPRKNTGIPALRMIDAVVAKNHYNSTDYYRTITIGKK